MRQVILTLTVIFAGTLGLGIAAGQDLNAQTVEPQVTMRLKADVAGVKGKEWKVITVELPPGAVDTRHSYPGVKLVYVLEGAGLVEVDGKPPVALNPGVVASFNPEQIHVLKNTSQTQTLKVLVVLFLEKGHQRPLLSNRGASSKAAEPNNSTGPGLVF